MSITVSQRPCLVAGTTSDAGKSVVTTAAVPRVQSAAGSRVAPFKAQNMSNNSMVCAGPDGAGAEIGRAQWIQALAARAEPEAGDEPGAAQAGQRPAQPSWW